MGFTTSRYERTSRSFFALISLTCASACVLLTFAMSEDGPFVVDINSESSKGPGVRSVLISGPATCLDFKVVSSIECSENFTVFSVDVSELGSGGMAFGCRII